MKTTKRSPEQSRRDAVEAVDVTADLADTIRRLRRLLPQEEGRAGVPEDARAMLCGVAFMAEVSPAELVRPKRRTGHVIRWRRLAAHLLGRTWSPDVAAAALRCSRRAAVASARVLEASLATDAEMAGIVAKILPCDECGHVPPHSLACSRSEAAAAMEVA